LASLAVAVLFVGCRTSPPTDHYLRAVSFPAVALRPGERIAAYRIKVTCARFRSVREIPNDWSLTVEGPRSERSALTAAANHGVSYLCTDEPLRRVAILLVCSESCFEISGTVTISGATGGDRDIRYGRAQMVLDPL
jgi:hypothetical protein